MHAGQVRSARCVDLRADEVALCDQVRDLRSLDEFIEDAAEPASITATWRGCEADDLRVGISMR